ncbi:unnamed protein product [Hyaloperonospora brassicae]|uniref:Uncharacterized protein n=1 Tax=Hyaloperonospora brassicae TaxID=162125 RepID=A0AAV0TN05_HYABA|nr:unnamed protein product [Hyaloperonospora brassicae]
MSAVRSRDVTPATGHWDVAHMPSQQHKVAIVTGANSGIGYETALALARNGASVVLACRNAERGRQAETALRAALATAPDAGRVEFSPLDLSDLRSVKAFAAAFTRRYARLDLLVNNAGIMGGAFQRSADGVERQFATNHLGHFALTAHLLPLLKQSAPSRVVTVSSVLHRSAASWNEDAIVVTTEDACQEMATYGVTKLCNVLFTKELARRLAAQGVTGVTAVACHPGVTASSLVTVAAKSSSSWFWWLVFQVTDWCPRQSCAMGALPTLLAATAPGVKGGDFYGPKHLKMFGDPVREVPSRLSESTSGAAKLWALSERLANVSFDGYK